MEWFKTEDEFREAFRRLNAFGQGDSRWTSHKARKDHVDIFGHAIEAGETYFSREYGAAFDARLIVSRRSMGSMLMAVLIPEGHIEQMADELICLQSRRLRSISDRLHRGAGQTPTDDG